MNKKYIANLQKANDEQNQRLDVMGKQFRASIEHEAEILGCDMPCVHKCMKDECQPNTFVSKCCDDGAIKVNYGEVNTIGIVERVYGDVANLS